MDTGITELLALNLTAKQKAKTIADALLSGALMPSDLLEAAPKLPESELAIVLESLEGATRKEPALVNYKLFTLLIASLDHTAPRVKWEAARTLSNVAKQHAEHLELAVNALLANTNHDGTVVRWATAQAFAVILRAGYSDNNLRAGLGEIAAKEQDEGVRGVYEKALRGRR